MLYAILGVVLYAQNIAVAQCWDPADLVELDAATDGPGFDLSLSSIQTPNMARDASGDLHALWASPSPTLTAWHGIKTNSGWAPPRQLPRVNAGSAQTKPALRLVNGSVLYASWIETTGNESAVVVGRSNDLGGSWDVAEVAASTDRIDKVSLYAWDGGAVVVYPESVAGVSSVYGQSWAAGNPWNDWTNTELLSDEVLTGSITAIDPAVDGTGDIATAVWQTTNLTNASDVRGGSGLQHEWRRDVERRPRSPRRSRHCAADSGRPELRGAVQRPGAAVVPAPGRGPGSIGPAGTLWISLSGSPHLGALR